MQITKISVFLRTVGLVADTTAYVVEKNSYCAFAAANFLDINNFESNCYFVPLVADASNKGCMFIKSSTSFPVLNYPIKSTSANNLYVFVKVKSVTYNNIKVRIYIDDVDQKIEEYNINNSEFVWLRLQIVVPDNKTHNIGISIETVQVYIDTVCVSTIDSLPATLSINSVFCTLHAVVSDDTILQGVDNVLFYDYRNNVEQIKNDAWYNFLIEDFGNIEITDTKDLLNMNLGLYVLGSSDQQYIVWDVAKDTDLQNDTFKTIYLNKTASNTFFIDNSQKFAVKSYTDEVGLDIFSEKIVIPPAKVLEKEIEDFNSEVKSPIFLQTEIVQVESNKNKVALSLRDRLITMIMDQSGSMTWNDDPKLRHKLARRLVDRIEATYPGEVKWNLLSFGGIPIKIDFYGVLESSGISSDNPSSMATTFFREQDSGFAGVRIVRNTDSFPLNPIDGDIVAEGVIDRFLDTNLEINKTYYYAAYTYNQSNDFSAPKYAQVKVQPKILPTGVGNYKYQTLVGTGVQRDANCLGLYHLNEAGGNVCVDFSNTNITLQASDDNYLWLNNTDVPDGASGLRLNGQTYFISSVNANHVANQYTFMAWVHPFDFNRERIIFACQNSTQNQIVYQIGIRSSGKLFFTIDAESYATSEFPLLSATWQHIAITTDLTTATATFYIDGVFAGVGVFQKGSKNTEEPQRVFLGSPSASFFGKITECSIHNIIRSENYITKYSRFPLRPAQKINDNGDRLVVLRYNISESSDYIGNTIKIIRKAEIGAANYTSDKNNIIILSTGGGSEVAPADPVYKFNFFGSRIDNITDGDLVYSASATVGEKIVTLPHDYLHGVIYNFRIYVENKLGNITTDSDSHNVGIRIPYFTSARRRNRIIPKPILPVINNFFAVAGNNKAYLYWDQVQNENVEQIRIYWSEEEYPTFDAFSAISNESLLVFIGNKDAEEYVDRYLTNDITAYYAIVTADRYGNVSQPVYLRVIPRINANESNIPLDTVKNFSYDLINEETVSLKWNLPVTFNRMIEGYFDDRVILFARITDIYGGDVPNIQKAKFNVSARIDNDKIPPNFFAGETEERELKVEQTYVIASTLVNNTTIKGVFRMVDEPDILAAINFILATIDVSFSVPDRVFGDDKIIVYSNKIGIRLINPVSMSVDNGIFGQPSGRGSNTIVQTRRTFAGSNDSGANTTGEDGGEQDGDDPFTDAEGGGG